MRLRKQELKFRCESHGLSAVGTKEALASRLFAYFQQGESSSIENRRETSTPVPDEHSFEDRDGSHNPKLSAAMANLSVEELRNLI